MTVLRVRGVPDDAAAPATPDTGRFGDIVRLSTEHVLRTGEVRGAAEQEVEVADDDVLELDLEGGIRLITSVARLRETAEWSGVRGAGDELLLPSSLQIGPPSRGAGRWAYRALRLMGVDLGRMAATEVVRRLESRLLDPPDGADIADGVLFRCATPVERGERITSADELTAGSPLLLLLHGTGSSTSGSFGGFAEPEARGTWERMRARYGGNIVAYDHATLSVSPIANALALLDLLPADTELHVVSHSRGGLVGELLCRGHHSNGAAGDGAAADPFGDAAGLFGRAGYEDERDALGLLGERLKEKRIRVRRFVRVACPARGTTLASGRLDFYLSIVFNAIGLIPGLRGNPVYEFTTALVAAVAKQRTDPRTLPGLEAMMPTSPLIATLNDPRARVAADLTAIAGDTEGSGVRKTLRTFVTDLFYRENHDLVVPTSAMTGGAARVDGARFHFAKGGQVDHFHYFRNRDTAEKVFAGLTRPDGSDAGFESVTQATATELKTRAPRPIAAGTRPVVFVVPGIMGSHLGAGDDRFWVDLLDMARGRFGRLAIDRDDVVAQALVEKTYDRLVEFLQRTHEVVPFPFDWRRSILEAADRLNDAVLAKLGETDKPVRIVAHSMGGLVARAMLARHAGTHERFVQRPGARLLMLGTPNGGSHSIQRVLLGQEKVLKYLAVLDFTRSQEELTALIARFTGMLQLLPATGDDDFFARGLWDTLRTAWAGGWTAPSAADLAAAKELWTLLRDRPGDPRIMAYVAGRAPATPTGYRIELDRSGADRIRFLATRQGDGRVPWATGRIDGVPTWYVDVVHGDIANHHPSFPGFLDLLEKGTTRLLSDQPPADVRGDAAPMVMPEDEVDEFPGADQLIAAAIGFRAEPETADAPDPLGVSVVHGNLAYARDPVAVGHYRGDTIAGAEATLDRHLGGALSERRQLGLYPGAIETAEVFLGDGKPAGAIVVGLGDVGRLTPNALERSFAHAVLRYAACIADREDGAGEPGVRTADVTSLLIGSGRGGIPAIDSIRAMVNGTLRARALLGTTPLGERVRIDRLELLELHEDVAIAAAHHLNALENDTAFRGRISVEAHIGTRPGGRRRASYEEADGWWDRLQIRSIRGRGLRFNNLTQRARSEVRLVATQQAVVDHFLRQAITRTEHDERLAYTLFDLLLPDELKEYAPDRNAVVLLLDADSARYPWELLQDPSQPGAEPIAVRTGLVRQLEEQVFRERVVTATGGGVLVVGDPRTHLSRLPGARREANAVAAVFQDAHFDVTRQITDDDGDAGVDFASILSALYARPWRVIHLAGHGVLQATRRPAKQHEGAAQRPPAEADRQVGGMVIGEHVYLTTGEMEQVRHVPELVFVNCCHLGSIDDAAERTDFPRLAATLARQLIRMGVRAVVAAGWEVQDDAAVTFARTFYEHMLDQKPFGQAVLAARSATHAAYPSSNTWGAYQCYGDQGFVLRSGERAEYTPRAKTGFVAAAELLVALENLCQDADITTQRGLKELRARLRELGADLPRGWRDRADVRAALGKACAQLDLFGLAIRHYRVLRDANDARYSVEALEQLANVSTRWAVARWLRRAGSDGGRAEIVIRGAIMDLESLPARAVTRHGGVIEMMRSAERLALMGSAYKRLSRVTMAETRAGALMLAAEAYAASARRGSFYHRLNQIACELVIAMSGLGEPPADIDARLAEAEHLAAEKERAAADFWTGAALADIAVLRAVHTHDIEAHADAICAQYTAAWRRGASPQKLRSVTEQLEWLADSLERADRAPEARAMAALRDCVWAVLDEGQP